MKIKDTMKKVQYGAKKHAPQILVVAGVVGVVGATVLACKATRKADKVISSVNEEIIEIKNTPMEEKEYKKELTKAYTKKFWNVGKIYAPAAALGVASIGCIVGSNWILEKRYMGMASAYATLDTAYKSYRERVAKAVGEDKEKELYFGQYVETTEETVIDKNGNEKIKKVKTERNDGLSPYGKFFDSSSRCFSKDPQINYNFLMLAQQQLNNDLRANPEGIVFLNDVYNTLDLPKTKAGQILGWKYNPNVNATSNNISLGIDLKINDRARDISCHEPVFYIDFVENPPYNVWEEMEWEK